LEERLGGRESDARPEVPRTIEVEAVAPVSDRRQSEIGNGDLNGAGQRPALQEDSEGASWPDESIESAFLAEARERGETLPPKRADSDSPEEVDLKSLPPLDELVKRIPAEVRETLDELFRARFVTVKRVPKKALKD
jgi:hypothetical protein